jgi:hypothetical protein
LDAQGKDERTTFTLKVKEQAPFRTSSSSSSSSSSSYYYYYYYITEEQYSLPSGRLRRFDW